MIQLQHENQLTKKPEYNLAAAPREPNFPGALLCVPDHPGHTVLSSPAAGRRSAAASCRRKPADRDLRVERFAVEQDVGGEHLPGIVRQGKDRVSHSGLRKQLRIPVSECIIMAVSTLKISFEIYDNRVSYSGGK